MRIGSIFVIYVFVVSFEASFLITTCYIELQRSVNIEITKRFGRLGSYCGNNRIKYHNT